MAAQHVYREGNPWGMTVGKTWGWPGNRFHPIPAITEDTEPIAAATKHGKEDQP